MCEAKCRACGGTIRQGSGRFDNILCPKCTAWIARENYRARRCNGQGLKKEFDKYLAKCYNHNKKL